MLTASELRTSDCCTESQYALSDDLSSGDITQRDEVHPGRTSRGGESGSGRVHFWDTPLAGVIKTKSAADARVAKADTGLIRERLFFDGSMESPAFLRACKRSAYYCRVKEHLSLDGLMLLILAGDAERSDRLLGNIKKTLRTEALNNVKIVVVTEENRTLRQRLEKLKASLNTDGDRLVVRGSCSSGTLGRLMKTAGLIASKPTNSAIGKLCVVARPVIVYEKNGAAERDNLDFMVDRQLALDGTVHFVAKLLSLVVERPMLQFYISESLKKHCLSHSDPHIASSAGTTTLKRHARRHSAPEIHTKSTRAPDTPPKIVISQT